MHHDLIIVGGGASGLIAAITAKDFGIDVAIVEGTDRIGKKREAIANINKALKHPKPYPSIEELKRLKKRIN